MKTTHFNDYLYKKDLKNTHSHRLNDETGLSVQQLLLDAPELSPKCPHAIHLGYDLH